APHPHTNGRAKGQYRRPLQLGQIFPLRRHAAHTGPAAPWAPLTEHYFLSLTSVNSASTTFSSLSLAPLAAPASPAAPWASACVFAYIASPSFCEAVINACAFASRASLPASVCLSSSSASFSAASILPFSSPPILSPYSTSDFFTLCTR